MKKTLNVLLAMTVIAAAACCNKPSSTNEEPGGGQTPPQTSDYPEGISVVEFADDLGDGEKCLGFVATVDFSKNDNLRFNVNYSVPKKTPSEIYANFPEKKGKAAIVINGGYFSGSTSVSLCIADKICRSYGSPSINWPNDENYKVTVYPVRSAIGLMADGKFQIQWNYCTDKSSLEQYAFPSAMGNNEKTEDFLAAPPDKNTPGAFLWEPVEAVGGGPRLVENGKNVAVENYWAEVLNSGGTAGTSRQPRTAIGITEDNRLIMIVCDGRGMRGSSGFTLSELADKFISLGARDAMNLDGGGSSAIVGKDGKVLNRPSDSGDSEEIVERKVVTSIVISEM